MHCKYYCQALPFPESKGTSMLEGHQLVTIEGKPSLHIPGKGYRDKCHLTQEMLASVTLHRGGLAL